MIRFLLIRHGESLSNCGNFLSGRLDVDLSALGYTQAELTARYLAEHYRVDAVYSSDLQRARHTVERIAGICGLPFSTDVGLREIDAGEFEGMSYERLRLRFPEEYAHWVTDIGTAVCPGGETLGEVQQRGEAALRRIAAGQPDGSVIVIGTHACFIRSLMCRWKGLPLSEMKNIPWVPNASVTEVDFDGTVFRLVREGISDHLAGMITNIPKGV